MVMSSMKRGLSPAVPTAPLEDGGTWGYLQAGYLHHDGFWWTKINPMRRRQRHHPWHHSGRFASGPPGLTHLTSLHFHAGKPKEKRGKNLHQKNISKPQRRVPYTRTELGFVKSILGLFVFKLMGWGDRICKSSK